MPGKNDFDLFGMKPCCLKSPDNAWPSLPALPADGDRGSHLILLIDSVN